jgi:hypothetical protein
MTRILISFSRQLAGAQAFVGSLIAFEAGANSLPDPAAIVGEGEDGQPSQVMFVAPGEALDTTAGFPIRTTVVSLTTSRDLDELNPMAERMEALDAATEMHVGDVVVAVKPGAFDGAAQ